MSSGRFCRAQRVPRRESEALEPTQFTHIRVCMRSDLLSDRSGYSLRSRAQLRVDISPSGRYGSRMIRPYVSLHPSGRRSMRRALDCAVAIFTDEEAAAE